MTLGWGRSDRKKTAAGPTTDTPTTPRAEKYVIVSANTHQELARKVNDYLDRGYVPHGHIREYSANGGEVHQTVISDSVCVKLNPPPEKRWHGGGPL